MLPSPKALYSSLHMLCNTVPALTVYYRLPGACPPSCSKHTTHIDHWLIEGWSKTVFLLLPSPAPLYITIQTLHHASPAFTLSSRFPAAGRTLSSSTYRTFGHQGYFGYIERCTCLYVCFSRPLFHPHSGVPTVSPCALIYILRPPYRFMSSILVYAHNTH